MYVRQLSIKNIRSIKQFEMKFDAGARAGWHVVLGSNGAGKSSVIRSLALVLAGPKEALALRQDWRTWARSGTTDGSITAEIDVSPDDIFTKRGKQKKSVTAELKLVPAESTLDGRLNPLELDAPNPTTPNRSIWGTNSGWFCASFGPFRRFTGGDQTYDRLYYSNPRLASHLSAFGEDVALTEGLRWLRELRVRELESVDSAGGLLLPLVEFLNVSGLLPHGARISEVRSEEVVVVDANGARVIVEQLSDGYRSVLSMIFEILRQMARSYGVERMLKALNVETGQVDLPGVVAIDEVDAHLHPSWQRDIGPWFTRCFPQVQFIVSTHSPIICRNASTVWRLANPGTDEPSEKIEGIALNRLIHGSILDAYGTEFFGRDVARSADSKEMLAELAQLNRKALRSKLDTADANRLDELRKTLPTVATSAGVE
ncbi:AAA family ATPase [Agrobacterium tumefaciens]|uniref:AAA family ATPase n=1 Tax=Agrobacterium tumefaciens TaxID=358 RepID=UPI00384F9365